MPRVKGAKNRSTILAEQFIAEGMDPKEAKVKARMQIAREAKVALKSTPATTKKTTRAKTTKKKKTVELPSIVEGYNTTTQNIWKRAKTSNSRKTAIRAMCLMCCGGSAKEVQHCSAEYCPLYAFRIKG